MSDDNKGAFSAQAEKANGRRASQRELAAFWKAEVLRLFREYHIYSWVPELFPGLSKKFLVGKRAFWSVDWERRLLIGSLHWEKQKPYRLVPRKDQFHALWKIQEKIGQSCLDDGLTWRIVIDPWFAEDGEHWSWLWYKAPPDRAPDVPPAARLPKCPPPLVGKAPYHLTRAVYPFAAWPTPNKPFVNYLGGGDYYFTEAISQPKLGKFGQVTLGVDGEPMTFKRVPWGVMPHHILLTVFNLHLVTKTPLIAFYDVRELLEAFGYAYGPDNRERIAGILWDMFHTKITMTGTGDPRGMDISPFAGVRLWGDTPAGLDSLGRRNQGRTARKGEQKNLFSSVILLNQSFLWWAKDQRLNDLDWALSNRLKNNPHQWRFYLKAVELGRRKSADYIPLGGKDGLLAEFGYNTQTSQKYRLAKSRFKKVVAAVRGLTRERYGKDFACPHYILEKRDLLRFYPWEPLHDYQSSKAFPVPSATRELHKLKIGPHEWESYRDTAMEAKRARMTITAP